MTATEFDAIRRNFIETAGQITQTLGVGRSAGQIFAHLYFSERPQTLDDLARTLRISKGGASMAARQLEQWGAVRRLWVQGDRKGYYEAQDSFGHILRKALSDLVGRRMEEADELLDDVERALKARPGNGRAREEELAFFRQRVARIRQFRDRARGLWDSPLVAMLLKG